MRGATMARQNCGTRTSHSYRLIHSCRSLSVTNGGVAQTERATRLLIRKLSVRD